MSQLSGAAARIASAPQEGNDQFLAEAARSTTSRRGGAAVVTEHPRRNYTSCWRCRLAVELANVVARRRRRRIPIGHASRLILQLRKRRLVGCHWRREFAEHRRAAFRARQTPWHRAVEELLGATCHTHHRDDETRSFALCHRPLSVKTRAPGCKMCAARQPGSAASCLCETHAVLDLSERFASHTARRSRTITNHLLHPLRVGADLRGASANRRELGVHVLEQHFLALDASPPRGATLRLDVRHDIRWAERLVEVIDVAHLWRTGIGSPHTRGIGDRRTQLLPDGRWLLEHADGVPHRLRHLRLAVEPHDAACWRELGLRLGKNPAAKPSIQSPTDFA